MGTKYCYPSNVKHIADYVFEGQGPGEEADGYYAFKSITFSQGLKTIGKYAFSGCKNLTNVKFPSQLQEIGDSAFYECEKLNEIILPDSVKKVGSKAFELCKVVAKIKLSPNLKVIENGTFYVNDLVTDIDIPSSVKAIKNSAFGGFNALTKIYIPSSVEYISNEALICSFDVAVYGQSGSKAEALASFLELDFISSNGNTIGEDSSHNIENDPYMKIEGTTLVKYLKEDGENVVIPSNVTEIGYEAFYGITFKNLIIPNTVTTLSDHAFVGCTFENLTIPKSVQDISSFCFMGCTFGSLKIEDGIGTIGEQAFTGCNVSTIVVPKSVYSIGEFAFCDLVNTKAIVFEGDIEYIGQMLFDFSKINAIYAIPGSNIWNYVQESGLDVYDVNDYQNISFTNYSDWAFSELQKADKYGLITDTIKSNMKQNITREEFAELAARLYEVYMDKSADKAPDSTFIDTKNPEVLKAYRLEIVNGVGNNSFSPKALTNREQIAAMLYRATTVIMPSLKSQYIEYDNSFNDFNKVESYFKESVKFMSAYEFIKGSNGKFDPKGSCTREMAVLIVVRIYEYLK